MSHVTRDSLHTSHCHTSDIVSVIRSVNCIYSSLSWQWRNIAVTHVMRVSRRLALHRDRACNKHEAGPAHNTIVKTEWNNFRLIHFIVWVLINMFVVCCHQAIQASYQVPLSRVKNIFYFPNTNSVHLAAIRILPQHDNGNTGSGYNFSCRSLWSQAVQTDSNPRLAWLAGVSWPVEKWDEFKI